MLALHIRLLTGRYVATCYYDRGKAEWPPHPTRVYSALVAGHCAYWGVGDGDGDSVVVEERGAAFAAEVAALDWLAALPPPQLVASEAQRRAVVTNFVPVNDPSATASAALQKRFDALATAASALKAASDALRAGPTPAPTAHRARLRRAHDKAQRSAEKAEEKLIAWGKSSTEGASGDRKVASTVIPERRTRQARTFPSVTPDRDELALIWPDADAAAHRAALDALASRLFRLGHSSSLVCARFATHAPTPNLIPDPAGELILRTTQRGQREMLHDAFSRHAGVEPRVLPFVAVAYSESRSAQLTPPTSSCFDPDWIGFRRIGGPRLGIEQVAAVTTALRGAILRAASDGGTTPGMISGHEADGRPLQRDHAAFIALPFCGHEHADGLIRGVAIVPPSSASDGERAALWTAVHRWERQVVTDDEELPALPLHLGRAGVLRIERIAWGRPMLSLRPTTWSRPSRSWRSVTPVALDRFPGDLSSSKPGRAARAEAHATATIMKAVARIGLPAPRAVRITRAAVVTHTPPTRAFPAFPAQVTTRANKPRRVLVHVALEFSDPVAGPVMIGAGRYLGLGLFRPMEATR